MAALDFPASPGIGQTYIANGKSWVWDGTTWVAQGVAAAGGSGLVLSTLHETVFAGMPTGTVPLGNQVINGITWNVSVGTGGAFSIVSTGLQAVLSSGSSENGFTGVAGEWGRIVGQDRWTRGRVATWTRLASQTRGTATSGFCYVNGIYAGAYPTYGLYNRRVCNGSGMQINGGMWFGSESGGQLNATTANDPSDVTMLYFRSPFDVEHWYGTWAGGWPALSSMKLGGTSRLTTGWQVGNNVLGATAANIQMMLASGGQAGNNTPTLVIDRFRITTWD